MCGTPIVRTFSLLIFLFCSLMAAAAFGQSLKRSEFHYSAPITSPAGFARCEDDCGVTQLLQDELMLQFVQERPPQTFVKGFVGGENESTAAAVRSYLEGEGRDDLAEEFVGPLPSLDAHEGKVFIDYSGSMLSRCGPVNYHYAERLGVLNGQLVADFEVTFTGDCGCKVIGGKRVEAFEIQLSGRRHAFESRRAVRQIVFDPVVDSGHRSCRGTAACNCPDREAILSTVDDLGIVGAPVGESKGIRVNFGAIPLRHFVLAGVDSTANCLTFITREPCNEQSRALANKLLPLIANQIPEEFVPSGSTFVAPTRDEVKPLVQKYFEIDWEGLSKVYSGEVPSECGSAQYQVKLFFDSDGVLTATIDMTVSGCSCAASGDLESLSYQFVMAYEQLVVPTGKDEVGVSFLTQEGSCVIKGQCCDAEAAPDALSTGFEFLWDTSKHCTFGGGSSPLAFLADGGAIVVPTPLAPLQPPQGLGGDPPQGGSDAPAETPAGTPVIEAGSPVRVVEEETAQGTIGAPPYCPDGETGLCDGYGEDFEFDSPCTGFDCDNPVATDSPSEDGGPPLPVRANPPPSYVPVGYTAKGFKAKASVLAGGASAVGAGITVSIAFEQELSETKGEDLAAGEGAYKGVTNELGEAILLLPDAIAAQLPGNVEFDVHETTGSVLSFDSPAAAEAAIAPILQPYVGYELHLDGTTFVPISIPTPLLVGGLLESFEQATAAATAVQADACVIEQPLSNPFFSSESTWEQPFADQWAIHRVGFTPDEHAAWQLVNPVEEEPIVIAVIDTGLDWNHQEINWDHLWRNDNEIFGNGVDDDNNGYIDDTMGWDFWDNDRSPWDVGGHGTFVAGVLFADPHNDEGIAGIARHARLMPLKAMNGFGHSRASSVARAIKYAADNGASIINLSLGGPTQSAVLEKAVAYAHKKDVVIVIAAGNEAANTSDRALTRLPNVLVVAASTFDDTRAIYSNYGAEVDIAAPGDDVLSLRARRTDILKAIPGVDYEDESAFVGADRRYYRASGTSFAAPIVAGVASLVRANNPGLTADEVVRVLKQSARDAGEPGVDHFTGYGIVDARAALQADPSFFIEPFIETVSVVRLDGKQALEVFGTASADQLERYTLELGKGEKPTAWKRLVRSKKGVNTSTLGMIPASEFVGEVAWTIRLTVYHKNGESREFRFLLNLA